MVRPFTSLAAVAVIGLLAGCGGGGSSPSGSQPPAKGGGTPTNQNGKTRASISVLIRPSKTSKAANAKTASAGVRKRDYVAPTTQGIVAEFVGNDSASDVTYQGYTLAANAIESSMSPASCGATADDGSFTCTLYFALAPNITYATTLTAYDAAQSGTSAQPASDSNALSTATQNLTISSNSSNTFSFTLSGIVEGFNITPQYVGVAGISPSGTLTGLFRALDADGNPIDEYDGSTGYVYGPQPNASANPATPGGPFTAASFSVVASDEPACTKEGAAKKRAGKRPQEQNSNSCLTTTSIAVMDPTTESVSYAYDGQGYGGDGTTNRPPYYGEITLTPPTNYAGFVSSGNAATLFIVPFFGFVDPVNQYGTGTQSVAFTAAGQTISAYATQYHTPTGAPTDGSGYTVDASSCGSIAAVGPTTYTAGVGISFTITSGNVGGSCTLTLSDNGTTAGADKQTIGITNSLPAANPSPIASPTASASPPALVQSNTGLNTVSLPSDVTAGDTLVLAIENFAMPSVDFLKNYGGFSVFSAAEDANTSIYLEDVTSSGALESFPIDGDQSTGGTTYWIGEFSGSSSAAIIAANSAINGVGGETVTITPNAASGLTLAAAENGSNPPPTNYQQFTASTGTGSQIQVDLSDLPTTDTTDPVTFDFGTNADSESAIQIAPASFSGSQMMLHRRTIDPAASRRHASRLRALLQARFNPPAR